MKRTYQIEIEIPDRFGHVDDWKVENLIATQIERAVIRPAKGDHFDREHLRVIAVDKIAEELTDPVTNMINAFLGVFSEK
jgi:hypothetical protein